MHTTCIVKFADADGSPVEVVRGIAHGELEMLVGSPISMELVRPTMNYPRQDLHAQVFVFMGIFEAVVKRDQAEIDGIAKTIASTIAAAMVEHHGDYPPDTKIVRVQIVYEGPGSVHAVFTV